jgi:hypothetical protein
MGANYFRVSRLVVLPDYQGVGIGKRLLNFIAEMYTSQMKLPFIIVTSNPQIIRGSIGSQWKVKRVGHAGKIGVNNVAFQRVGHMIQDSTSGKRLSVSLQYIPAPKSNLKSGILPGIKLGSYKSEGKNEQAR